MILQDHLFFKQLSGDIPSLANDFIAAKVTCFHPFEKRVSLPKLIAMADIRGTGQGRMQNGLRQRKPQLIDKFSPVADPEIFVVIDYRRSGSERDRPVAVGEKIKTMTVTFRNRQIRVQGQPEYGVR